MRCLSPSITSVPLSRRVHPLRQGASTLKFCGWRSPGRHLCQHACSRERAGALQTPASPCDFSPNSPCIRLQSFANLTNALAQVDDITVIVALVNKG